MAAATRTISIEPSETQKGKYDIVVTFYSEGPSAANPHEWRNTACARFVAYEAVGLRKATGLHETLNELLGATWLQGFAAARSQPSR